MVLQRQLGEAGEPSPDPDPKDTRYRRALLQRGAERDVVKKARGHGQIQSGRGFDRGRRRRD